MKSLGEDGWAPQRDVATRRWSVRRSAGPYRLGPEVRVTRRGVTHLAAHADHDRVLELELYTSLREHVRADVDGALMLDLALVSTLKHRHLAPIVGLGLYDGAPYVARPHLPGRCLCEVLGRGPLEQATAVGVLYSLAEVIGFLADEGPEEGACSLGGFDVDDVLLGFDGSIHLVGVGLKRARKGGARALEGDLEALDGFAQRLAPRAGLPPVHRNATRWAREVSRRFPDACGMRAALVGRTLRARFAEVIPEERAALGLPTLH